METTRWTGGLRGSQPSHHTRETGKHAIQKQRNRSPLSTKRSNSRSTRSWAEGHTPAGVPFWDSEPQRCGQDLPGLPACPPGCTPGPRGGPRGTHLLIRPACSCWRSRDAAAGGHCPSPGRQRPSRCRAPLLSSRPPACEAPRRDRWVLVARCPALRELKIRSTVEI
jgi:hypothetical protein